MDVLETAHTDLLASDSSEAVKGQKALLQVLAQCPPALDAAAISTKVQIAHDKCLLELQKADLQKVCAGMQNAEIEVPFGTKTLEDFVGAWEPVKSYVQEFDDALQADLMAVLKKSMESCLAECASEMETESADAKHTPAFLAALRAVTEAKREICYTHPHPLFWENLPTVHPGTAQPWSSNPQKLNSHFVFGAQPVGLV